jgi:hypothetical protein
LSIGRHRQDGRAGEPGNEAAPIGKTDGGAIALTHHGHDLLYGRPIEPLQKQSLTESGRPERTTNFCLGIISVVTHCQRISAVDSKADIFNHLRDLR